MEFRTLNYFLGVLENRSYTAAAEALHITQPALTKAVQRLEAELEVELFDRDSRGTEPTKYGELLAVHARRLNEEHKHAKLEIENLKNGFNESVRVGAGPVWSSRMLPQATKRLREEGKNIKISLSSDTSSPLTKRLLDGSLDLICGDIDFPVHPDICKEHIQSVEYVLCGRREHPLSRKSQVEYQALTDYSWAVLPNTLEKLQPLFDSLEFPKLDIAIEVASVDELIVAASTEDYLVALPESLLGKAEVAGVVRLPLKGALYKFSVGVAYMKEAQASSSIASVISIIKTFSWD